MAGRIRAFGAFAYDFVIGDDWWVAAGVAAGLAVTYLLAHVLTVAAWWLIPVAAGRAAAGQPLARASASASYRLSASSA